ncbi:MAG: hypothetical protein HQK52_10865 [Oligoflexia bacterium]|nr:hypothetical protein [Oligoflexia bacterium]
MKKSRILLLSLLLFSFMLAQSQIARAVGNDEKATTYIKSIDGPKEVPVSWLKGKRSKGSTFEEFSSRPPIYLPSSPEEAPLFPIAGKSLDSILSFLKDSTISYELCDSERLCKDVDECKLSKMSHQLRADIQERESFCKFFQNYPLWQNFIRMCINGSC